MSNIFSNNTDLSKKQLSIYITAGFPGYIECLDIVLNLEKLAVDFIELGMPYSDPLADGETIQESSNTAIENGMTMNKYFELLGEIRKKSNIPVVYMGYLNQIMQFGINKFCKKCIENNISSVIIPDLPVNIYEKEFKQIFNKFNLSISFLITPTTSLRRIREIENKTTGFIYVVSSNSITGKKENASEQKLSFYKKTKALKLSKPYFFGFGIHDKKSFQLACKYANGAIIGSEFIRQINKKNTTAFINSLK